MPTAWRAGACALLSVVLLARLAAQSPPPDLTIAAIYDPLQGGAFGSAVDSDLTWIDDSHYRKRRPVADGVEWLTVDAVSGSTAPLFDAARAAASLAALPGVDGRTANQAVHARDLVFTAGSDGAIVTIADDLFAVRFGGGAVRLTSGAEREELPTFSPDGRQVAFVRGHDLYTVDATGGAERRLTQDGSPALLNGMLDWLYQEEIYGRGRFRGYWWSPDSTRLAFLRLDEAAVPDYTLVDTLPYRPRLETTDYPKAGDRNPDVRLGIVAAAGGAVTWADLNAYPSDDRLLVNVAWTPDAAQVVCQVQNREQTWLDLMLADAATGALRRILRETTPAWVNENGSPVWLDDGTFLWLSERSGFRHIYHYRTDGTLVRQVTNGRWTVDALHGADREGSVYFAANERSAIGTDLYRVGLDGRGQRRLSAMPGTHRGIFNRAFSHYLDVWSDVTMPAEVRLHRRDGSEARAIETTSANPLGSYRVSAPRFLEIPARDGVILDAMMITPPDFDPTRRYPVYQLTYAGPGTPSVRNQWGGSTYAFHQLLAQRGFIVWVLDNRSAGARGGSEAQWPVYGALGEQELRDLEDGVAWLRRQPYVDASRLVLSGWSYGGFMTAYALTHSTSWSAGIAGGTVSDWRDYDTIYTERYMRTPQHNEDGYRRTAPRFAADRLHGRLLLIHGTMDDNVHMQNSEQLAYALQQAGTPFELMIYPSARHGVTDPRQNLHLHELMLDFVTRAVGGPRPAPSASATTR